MPKINFSEREIKVMRLICKEFTNDEIAEKLKLSSKTIDVSRKILLKKTNSRNMVGIAKFAIKHKYFNLK